MNRDYDDSSPLVLNQSRKSEKKKGRRQGLMGIGKRRQKRRGLREGKVGRVA